MEVAIIKRSKKTNVNRKLHCLIAIDLKPRKFKAQHKSQMELYLRWLEAHEMESGEEQYLGLLFCTEGGDEQIELLQRQIHKGMEAARQRWENHPYN